VDNACHALPRCRQGQGIGQYQLQKIGILPLVKQHNYGKSPFFIGKSSIFMAHVQ